jgi:hypothetical protein
LLVAGYVALDSLDALPEKVEQLGRGMKAKLDARIDFFDPPVEATFGRVGLGAELHHERASHQDLRVDRAAPGRVKVAFNSR